MTLRIALRTTSRNTPWQDDNLPLWLAIRITFNSKPRVSSEIGCGSVWITHWMESFKRALIPLDPCERQSVGRSCIGVKPYGSCLSLT